MGLPAASQQPRAAAAARLCAGTCPPPGAEQPVVLLRVGHSHQPRNLILCWVTGRGVQIEAKVACGAAVVLRGTGGGAESGLDRTWRVPERCNAGRLLLIMRLLALQHFRAILPGPLPLHSLDKQDAALYACRTHRSAQRLGVGEGVGRQGDDVAAQLPAVAGGALASGEGGRRARQPGLPVRNPAPPLSLRAPAGLDAADNAGDVSVASAVQGLAGHQVGLEGGARDATPVVAHLLSGPRSPFRGCQPCTVAQTVLQTLRPKAGKPESMHRLGWRSGGRPPRR